ncbi:ATP-binding protein [Mycobacterium sp. AMU20-3851]|uniref:ATP-binding protein n=1 Tax=Mycobacterium sp. AMU20-3851 TaxID=3122055 RepID=UPI0037549190
MSIVAIAAVGSRGDVAPLAGLGGALRKNGHRVVIAAYTPFAELIADAGCEFRELPADFTPGVDHADASSTDTVAAMFTSRGQRDTGQLLLDALGDVRADILLLPPLAELAGLSWRDDRGAPGIGKTHLAIGLGVKAAHAGYSVLFDTASNWIARLGAAHHGNRLEAELKKIRRYKLIIIDEVGYIPFDQDAANLFFQLIASRYEIGSIMVTSNLPFGRWGETFSDDVVAAAMIDRLVHHAEVLTLTGDSYRTRTRRELLGKNRTNNS